MHFSENKYVRRLQDAYIKGTQAILNSNNHRDIRRICGELVQTFVHNSNHVDLTTIHKVLESLSAKYHEVQQYSVRDKNNHLQTLSAIISHQERYPVHNGPFYAVDFARKALILAHLNCFITETIRAKCDTGDRTLRQGLTSDDLTIIVEIQE
jgi:hypothetical protein